MTGRLCECGAALQDTIVHFGEKGRAVTTMNWAGACTNADVSGREERAREREDTNRQAERESERERESVWCVCVCVCVCEFEVDKSRCARS